MEIKQTEKFDVELQYIVKIKKLVLTDVTNTSKINSDRIFVQVLISTKQRIK